MGLYDFMRILFRLYHIKYKVLILGLRISLFQSFSLFPSPHQAKPPGQPLYNLHSLTKPRQLPPQPTAALSPATQTPTSPATTQPTAAIVPATQPPTTPAKPQPTATLSPVTQHPTSPAAKQPTIAPSPATQTPTSPATTQQPTAALLPVKQHPTSPAAKQPTVVSSPATLTPTSPATTQQTDAIFPATQPPNTPAATTPKQPTKHLKHQLPTKTSRPSPNQTWNNLHHSSAQLTFALRQTNLPKEYHIWSSSHPKSAPLKQDKTSQDIFILSINKQEPCLQQHQKQTSVFCQPHPKMKQIYSLLLLTILATTSLNITPKSTNKTKPSQQQTSHNSQTTNENQQKTMTRSWILLILCFVLTTVLLLIIAASFLVITLALTRVSINSPPHNRTQVDDKTQTKQTKRIFTKQNYKQNHQQIKREQ